MVINIPRDVSHLDAGAGSIDGDLLPEGSLQIRSDYGFYGYGGPCPPIGDAPHNYEFTLHALKTEKLDLLAQDTTTVTGFMIHANSLATASLNIPFGR